MKEGSFQSKVFAELEEKIKQRLEVDFKVLVRKTVEKQKIALR